MRTIEIILKLAFLALAIYVIAAGQVFTHWLVWLMDVGLVLGLVLIFNKKESYGYPKDYPKINRIYMIRRIEGALLILATLIVYLHS